MHLPSNGFKSLGWFVLLVFCDSASVVTDCFFYRKNVSEDTHIGGEEPQGSMADKLAMLKGKFGK